MSGLPVTRPAPDLPAGPRAALVVATTDYADPVLRRLRSPATDAAELAAVLADPAVGGFEVTTVLDPSAQELRIAVHDFLDARAPEDLVLVYLSCHGLTDLRRRLYFAAADTVKARLAATGVESAWLMERLEDCRAGSQVLILDCCFSGAVARGFKGADELCLEDRLAPSARGRVVLTASNAREYSFEGGLNGDVAEGDTAPGSVFTSALSKGLSTGAADFDGDGRITVDDAYGYAYEQVRAAGAAQTPQRWLAGGEGQIVLARNPAGVPVLAAPVPEWLRSALDSPSPHVRLGAVHTLGEWLNSGDPARQLTAHDMLEEIANTDIPRVATAARTLLPATATISTDPQLIASGPPPHPASPRDQLAGLAATDASAKRSLAWTEEAPRVLSGHASTSGGFDGALSLAFSPAKALLASGGGDGTVRLWDPQTGAQLRDLTVHLGAVLAVALSPDGQLLASGHTRDPKVRLWDPGNGRTVGTLAGHTDWVRAVAFSPDGRLLATASDDHSVRLWDPKTAAALRTLSGHKDWVLAVAFSPDGRLLVSGSRDGTVRLWDPKKGAELRTLSGHTSWVSTVAFSPDGELLASGGCDQTVRTWNPQAGTPLRTLRDHSEWVRAVAFSPDGRLLVSGSEDRTARLWDPGTGDLLRVISQDSKLQALAFSPDGRLLASGDEDGAVRVWRVV